jgi:hypothetical protein
VKAVKEGRGERPFNLVIDLEQLEREYDLTQVKLVMIGPVAAYLGLAAGSRAISRRPCSGWVADAKENTYLLF